MGEPQSHLGRWVYLLLFLFLVLLLCLLTSTDKGTVIPKDNVAVNTPIATTSYSGTQHVIVVDNAEQHTIQDYVNGKPSPIERFYPGSSLGAICPPAVKPILFYKSLNPVGVIKTKVFNGSSWEDGATVA